LNTLEKLDPTNTDRMAVIDNGSFVGGTEYLKVKIKRAR